MKGHACLTSCHVGLSDKGGSGPTWFSRKEREGLPGRSQGWGEVRSQRILDRQNGSTEPTRLVKLVMAAQEPLGDFRRLGFAELIAPIDKEVICGVRQHVYKLRAGRVVLIVKTLAYC